MKGMEFLMVVIVIIAFCIGKKIGEIKQRIITRRRFRNLILWLKIENLSKKKQKKRSKIVNTTVLAVFFTSNFFVVIIILTISVYKYIRF